MFSSKKKASYIYCETVPNCYSNSIDSLICNNGERTPNCYLTDPKDIKSVKCYGIDAKFNYKHVDWENGVINSRSQQNVKDWEFCDNRGGRAQCPSGWPFMVSDTSGSSTGLGNFYTFYLS